METTIKTTKTRRARPGEARAWLNAVLADIHAGKITDECLLWPFSTNGGDGGRYPQIRIDGHTVRVTRYLYRQVTGCALADGELIRHTCDQPRCCNVWAHFEVGDHEDNMRDMVNRQRAAAGERNGNARLTAADIRDIRQIAADHGIHYGDVSFIARGYGVSPTTIALILADKLWRATIAAENITQQRADPSTPATR